MNIRYKCLARFTARHPYYGSRPTADIAFVPIGDTMTQLQERRILLKSSAAPAGLSLVCSSKPEVATNLDLVFAAVIQRPALLNVIAGLPRRPDRLGSKIRRVEIGPEGRSEDDVRPTAGRLAMVLLPSVRSARVEVRRELDTDVLFTDRVDNPEPSDSKESFEWVIDFSRLPDGFFRLESEPTKPQTGIYYKGTLPPGTMALVRFRTASTDAEIDFGREVAIDFTEATIAVKYHVSIRYHQGAFPDPRKGVFKLEERDKARSLATPAVERIASSPGEVLLRFEVPGVALREAPFRDYGLLHSPDEEPDEEPDPRSPMHPVIEHLPGLPLEHVHPIVHVSI